jgi:hypothetical protein
VFIYEILVGPTELSGSGDVHGFRAEAVLAGILFANGSKLSWMAGFSTRSDLKCSSRVSR